MFVAEQRREQLNGFSSSFSFGFLLGLAIALKSALSTELQQVAAVDSYRNENY